MCKVALVAKRSVKAIRFLQYSCGKRAAFPSFPITSFKGLIATLFRWEDFDTRLSFRGKVILGTLMQV